MLEKASDELDPRQRDASHLLGTVIAIAETDHAVVDGFQAAVGDGDSEDVASQVVENLVATSGVLRMNDPSFLPGRHWDAGKQSRLFQSRTDFGTEDDRQGLTGDKEAWVLQFDPGCPIGGEATSGDEHMDVRMEEHGTCPGVKDGESADAGAKMAGIVGEFL